MTNKEPWLIDGFDIRTNAERERDTAIEELTEAIRFTVEYVGTDMLRPFEGWSWYDALVKYAPEKAEALRTGPVYQMGGKHEETQA